MWAFGVYTLYCPAVVPEIHRKLVNLLPLTRYIYGVLFAMLLAAGLRQILAWKRAEAGIQLSNFCFQVCK